MNSYEAVSSYSKLNQAQDYSSHASTNTRFHAATDTNQSGYLYKKGSSGTWQKRYFEVNGSYLTYYKTHHMNKLLAAISMPQVGAIRLTGEVSDSLGTGVVFEMQLKDRMYYLRSETYDDARKWVDTLTYLRDGKATNSSNPLNEPLQTTDASSAMLPETMEISATLQKSTRTSYLCCFSRR